MGLTTASGPRSSGRAIRPLLLFSTGLVAVLLAGAAAGYPFAPGAASTRAHVSGTSRLVQGRNAHDAALKNDYLYDSAYETCGALGLARLSQLVRSPARPLAAAHAYARKFDRAERAGPYGGCLQALTEPAARPGDARARN